MKIRAGFVSNSSSSSFIVSRAEYQKSLYLAKHMIEIRNSDEWPNGGKDIEKIERALKNRDLNHDIPVTFSTCNYNTYIIPQADRFLVSTCNNTNWGDIRGTHSYGGGEDDGDWHELENKTDFWYICYGVIGKPLTWDEIEYRVKKGELKNGRCALRGHYRSLILVENKCVCPLCWELANQGKDLYLDQVIIKIKPVKIKKTIRLR